MNIKISRENKTYADDIDNQADVVITITFAEALQLVSGKTLNAPSTVIDGIHTSRFMIRPEHTVQDKS